jgi:hypothetical protein
VIKEADGRYYASFVVEREAAPLPAGDREIGHLGRRAGGQIKRL